MTHVAASDDESDGDGANASTQAERSAQSSPAENDKGEGFKWPAADGRAFASVMIVSGVYATALHGSVLVVVNDAAVCPTATVAHTLRAGELVARHCDISSSEGCGVIGMNSRLHSNPIFQTETHNCIFP
jgi:hypothetical protein